MVAQRAIIGMYNFNENIMKKVYIISITVLAIIAIGFLGWYLLKQNPEAPIIETVGNILPFGSGSNSDIPVSPTDNRYNAPEGDAFGNNTDDVFNDFRAPSANLFRISNTPVAGMTVLKKDGATVVRHVDRATGHIYDTNLTTLARTKISNQTLPKIYEAYFKSDGNAVLLRSLKDNSDTVENLLLALTPPSSSTTSSNSLYTTTSVALRGDIGDIAVGAGNILVYSLKDAASVISSTFSGTNTKTLFTSPFTDWRLTTTENNAIAYTKASASAPGIAYTLNLSNGALTKILGPLDGLVVTPDASGKRLLYSYVENDKTRLFAQNLTSGAQTEILPASLAEKCIWSVKQTGTIFCGSPIHEIGPGEPDDWYMGLTHFSDRIFLFDVDNYTAQSLVEPRIALGISLDLIEPKLSPDEDYLVFINKTDLSLWALKLD